LILPLVPEMERWQYAEIRNVSSTFFSIGLAIILSLALGWSAIGRDLAERRLGFYFARPLTSASIWCGKFAGSALIVAAAAILVDVPAELSGGGLAHTVPDWVRPNLYPRHLAAGPMWPLAGFMLALAAVLLFLLAFANMLGLILRARTAWAAANIPLVFAAIMFGSIPIYRLVREEAFDLLWCMLLGLGGCILISLWAGLAAQVSSGRTDIIRSHHMLSRVVWILVFAGLLICELGSRWVVDVDAQDLAVITDANQANRGTWLAVAGRAKYRGNYQRALLFDSRTGRSLRTGAGHSAGWYEWPLISDDGNRAVWLENAPREKTASLFLADLERANPQAVRIPIPISGPTSLSISSKGDRVALRQPNLVTLYSLPQGDFLGGTALRAPNRMPSHVQFLTPDRVRIFVGESEGGLGSTKVQILEFDAAARSLIPLGKIEGWAAVADFPAGPGNNLIAWSRFPQGRTASLLDARTGELRKWSIPSAENVYAQFLADGRIIALTFEGGSHPLLHLLSSEGDEQRVIPLPHRFLKFGEEYAHGRLAVALSPDPGRRTDQPSLYEVNLDTGETRHLADGLLPIDRLRWAPGVASFVEAPPGTRPKGLYISTDRALVEFNPATGISRTLIGPRYQSQ
jgi:hypothetical protein